MWSAEGSTAGFTIDTRTGRITGTIPVQGEMYPNPLTSDLILDQAIGILSGSITRDDAGETHLTTVHARNEFGEDTKTIELVAGGDHEGNVRFRDRYEAREKEEGNDTWSSTGVRRTPLPQLNIE